LSNKKDLLKDTLENGLTYYLYKYDKDDFKGKAYFQLIQKPDNGQAILNRVKTLITKMSEGGVITNQHVENYIKSRLKNSVKKPKYYESLSILFDSYKNGGVDHRIKSEKYIRTLTVENLQDFIKEFLEKSFRHEIVVKGE